MLVKRAERGEQVYALCRSKDRQRLAARIAKGRLKQRDLINQAIGRPVPASRRRDPVVRTGPREPAA